MENSLKISTSGDITFACTVPRNFLDRIDVIFINLKENYDPSHVASWFPAKQIVIGMNTLKCWFIPASYCVPIRWDAMWWDEICTGINTTAEKYFIMFRQKGFSKENKKASWLRSCTMIRTAIMFPRGRHSPVVGSVVAGISATIGRGVYVAVDEPFEVVLSQN